MSGVVSKGGYPEIVIAICTGITGGVGVVVVCAYGGGFMLRGEPG